MSPKTIKLVSIVALSLMFSWWFATKGLRWSVQGGGYMEVYALVVCLAALMLIAVTAHERKYVWAAAFTAIAVLFNPFALFTLSRTTFLVLDGVCMAAFVLSLALSWTNAKSKLALGKLSDV